MIFRIQIKEAFQRTLKEIQAIKVILVHLAASTKYLYPQTKKVTELDK